MAGPSPVPALAGAAYLAGLGRGGGRPPPPRPHPPLTLQFSIRAADYNVVTDDQHLYVFEHTGNSLDTVVVAYRLTDGTVAWRTELPRGRGSLALWDDALLVVAYDETGGGDSLTDQTTRLDRDSGRPLWTRSGWPSGRIEGHMLFGQVLSAEVGEHERSSIAMVDLATGESRWSIEANRWGYEPGGAPALVTLDGQSTLASYDLATGGLLATAATAAPTDPDHPSYWGLQTLGSVVLLAEESDGAIVLNAYDTVTLQRRWALPAGVNMWANRCGDLICLLDSEDVPRAVDPGSGRTVWSADWLPPATAEAGFAIYDPGFPELAGYTVLSNERWQANEWRSWLIDMETGRPVLDLGQWQLTGGFWGTPNGSPSALLTLNTASGTWVGRLRPDLSGVDALGEIEGATLDEDGYGTYCAPAAGHVICYTEALTGDALAHTDIQVWRLR